MQTHVSQTEISTIDGYYKDESLGLISDSSMGASSTRLAFDRVDIEFSPGTGGLRVPYIHLNVPNATPPHFIITGGTPDLALRLFDSAKNNHKVEIRVRDRHSRGNHQVARLETVKFVW